MSGFGQKVKGWLQEVDAGLPSLEKLGQALLQEVMSPDDYAEKGVKIVEDLLDDGPAVWQALHDGPEQKVVSTGPTGQAGSAPQSQPATTGSTGADSVQGGGSPGHTGSTGGPQ